MLENKSSQIAKLSGEYATKVWKGLPYSFANYPHGGSSCMILLNEQASIMTHTLLFPSFLNQLNPKEMFSMIVKALRHICTGSSSGQSSYL